MLLHQCNGFGFDDLQTNSETLLKDYNRLKSSMICAIVIFILSFSYISAIYYASFLIATLFKSCNLLSMVFVEECCSQVHEKGLNLEKNKIIVALLIIMGLMIFKSTSLEAEQGEAKTT